MKVIMKIMMIQEVGKGTEEIKTGMMMKTAIAIQEEVLAAWVIIVE